MEKRRFGRTGHLSTVAVFGAAAFWDVSQAQADETLAVLQAHGVNHIDVAPQYGLAEERVGHWMMDHRSKFFLGCKTLERTRDGAWAELHRSLEKLQTDHLDLYQLHSVSTPEDMQAIFTPDGALQALIDAREAGLTAHLGITIHGLSAPALAMEALDRFDFDTVLFPLNATLFAYGSYREEALRLIDRCKAADVGVFTIKAATKAPWGDRPKTNTTWYEPYTELPDLQKAVDFALSHDITGICTAGDVTVLPNQLQACEHFKPMQPEVMAQMIDEQQGAAQIFH